MTLRGGGRGDNRLLGIPFQTSESCLHFLHMEMVLIKDPSPDAGHGHPDVMALGVDGKG